MTTRQKSYEKTLRERGLPQDISTLVTKYAPFEDLRNKFKDVVISLYGHWVPRHFLNIDDNKFDNMIQTLWDLMGTSSLREYIKRNFWRMYYTRDKPSIPNEIDELLDGREVNMKDLIDNSIIYELKGRLYDAFFNPDHYRASYSWSKSDYLNDDYSIFFLELLGEMMSRENIEATFDDFLQNNDVDLNLGTALGAWTDDPNRLIDVGKTMGFTGTKSDIYDQLEQHHQKYLDSL